jgi:hypothetical protein
LCENQHDIPSPLLLSNVFAHPSGHELPIKQNGAIPYHLHTASVDFGTIVKNKRKTTVVVNNDEAIIKSTMKKNNLSHRG